MQNKKLNKTSSNAKLVKTPEVKAEVKETVQDIAKKAKDVVTKTADTAEKTVKEAAAKTADAAEKTVKEVAAKTADVAEKTQTAAAKTADAAEKTVKKAETKVKATAKKPAAKKAAKEVLKPEITVQYQNLEVTTEVVEERVKAQFAAEGHRVGTIKKLNIYVKPEEYAAYYVINDKFTGRVDLF